MMITGASGALPPEILQPVLESLGSSLASAIPCCRSIASAAEQGSSSSGSELNSRIFRLLRCDYNAYYIMLYYNMYIYIYLFVYLQ